MAETNYKDWTGLNLCSHELANQSRCSAFHILLYVDKKQAIPSNNKCDFTSIANKCS